MIVINIYHSSKTPAILDFSENQFLLLLFYFFSLCLRGGHSAARRRSTPKKMSRSAPRRAALRTQQKPVVRIHLLASFFGIIFLVGMHFSS